MPLDDVAEAYRAMDSRQALKVMVVQQAVPAARDPMDDSWTLMGPGA